MICGQRQINARTAGGARGERPFLCRLMTRWRGLAAARAFELATMPYPIIERRIEPYSALKTMN
jgi:hypothetical protein